MTDPFHEQVAQLRRQQILEAAIRVFAARGFHRATVRDIARAAGVADGTIYNYFASKDAILLGILDPANERERFAATPPPLPDDPREFFEKFFTRRWLDFSGRNLPALRVVLSEVLVNSALRALFVERVIAPTLVLAEPAFQHFIARGAIRPVDVPLTLRTLVGTFLGLLLLRLMDDQTLGSHWDELPATLTALLLDGLLPPATTEPGAGAA